MDSSTPDEARARLLTPAPGAVSRPGVSLDAWALALAAVIALAVVAGVLPAVPW